MCIRDRLSSLKGLGPKRLQALQKMNINSPEELIKLAPSDYMDMSRIVKIADMPDNGYALIFARITSAPYCGRAKTVFSACSDDSACADLIWFNAPYLSLIHISSAQRKSRLHNGRMLYF